MFAAADIMAASAGMEELYRVPYDDFVRNESLKAFFRKGVDMGGKTAPRCYPGATFHQLCAAFAQSFDVTLFLLEIEGDVKTLTVFNRGDDKKRMTMFRTPQNLISLSRTPRSVTREVEYEPRPLNEQEEEEEDLSMDAQDLPDENWAAPAKRYKTSSELVKNVRYQGGAIGDIGGLHSGDLLIKLSDKYEMDTLHQVCCFGVDKKVIFRQGVIYRQPSVLHVPGGFGTAMEHGGATDVYLLTSGNAVIKKINLYKALRDLVTAAEWSVDIDRFVQNFRATSYAGGECLYTYARPDKNMVEYTDGFDNVAESVYEMNMGSTVLSAPESPLIATPANVLEVSKIAVVAARKEEDVKKLPEKVVDAFYVFLLRAGVAVDKIEPHDAFVNVNEINIKILEANGTLNIDLSTFVTPGVEGEDIFLEIVDWVEQKTGAIFPKPDIYITTQ